MNKLLSLALSAALLAMPVIGSAETTLDTAMNAVSAADGFAARFNLFSAPDALEAMGLTDDSAQTVSGMLDKYSSLDMVMKDNMFHASLDSEDSALFDFAAEIDGGNVYLSSSLLDGVYCISADELTKLAGSTTSVQTGSLGISQETINEIARKLGTLDYNFDSTIAYVSTLAGKIETFDENGSSGSVIMLSGEEVFTLLKTAAADFTATEGVADVLAAYIPGITADNLKESIDSLIDQAAAQYGACSLTGSLVTDENGTLYAALGLDDGADNNVSVELTLTANTADITLYQVSDDEKTALCSLTASWKATDDTAKADIALTVGDEQFKLSLGAAGEEDALGLSAGINANGTQLGSAVLTIMPYDETIESWISDKTGAVDIMTLSEDDKEALCAEMAGNLQSAFSGDGASQSMPRVHGNNN